MTGNFRLALVLKLTVAFHIALAPGADGLALDPEISGPVWTETGVWRTKVQQIFDAKTRTLSRRAYQIWDPEPSRDLDFVWTPDDAAADKPGRIDGAGHLIWRVKGKPTYDRTAVFAEYRGVIRKGRIEGVGAYLDQTGLYYEGAWKAGRMHGAGALKLPSGDEYTGAFRDGKANGKGRYIDVTGEIYDGPFVNGQRHGRGDTTLPNGHVYRSSWTDGKESEGSRLVRLAQAGGKMTGGADDIRIAITIDKRLPPPPPDSEERDVNSDLTYAITNTANGLRIRPDNKRLMSLWKEEGEIQLLPDEEGSLSDDKPFGNYGVVSVTKAELVPLKLQIEVQNRSRSDLQVTGAYLDVEVSKSDLKPAIQLSVLGDTCVQGDYRSSFYLDNLGWSAAEDAVARFDFAQPHASGRASRFALTKTIGKLDKRVKVDIESQYQAAGVNVAVLKRAVPAGFTCSASQFQTCLRDIRASGIFGALSDRIGLVEDKMIVVAKGVLEYTWRDSDGNSQRASSPFRADMVLGRIKRQLECGEGADSQVIAATAQQLRLDTANYRVPVSFQSRVPAGRTNRLVLPIKADKSSEHNFAVVLQLSDGREVRSRPINLLYYTPRWFTATEGE